MATHGVWFVTLWAAAVLFHLAANGDHLLAADGVGMIQLAMMGAAAKLLLRPSARAAAALATLYLLVFWLKSPVVGNHEVILALVGLAVLAASLRSPAAWPAVVAPCGRWILVVAYGFIALSKLNFGFFDPGGSCALLFARALGGAFGIDRIPAVLAPAVIGATAAVELAIPVLLIGRRFRAYGVVLALGFHFVLALDPVGHVWDFSATLTPLFLLFMPAGFHGLLDEAIARFSSRPLFGRGLFLGLILALQGLVMSGMTPLPRWLVAYGAWLAMSVAIGVLAARWVIRESDGPRFAVTEPGRSARSPGGARSLGGAHWPRGRWAQDWAMARWLIPVIVAAVAIGAGPYIGYRSAASFNMYSNLRVVDGESNHVLIRSRRHGAEPSVVEIVDAAESSPLRYYVGRELLVPVENIDRYLAANPAEEPLIRLDGETVGARRAGLGKPDRSIGLWPAVSSELRYRFGFRRSVDASSGGRCLRAWGPIG